MPINPDTVIKLNVIGTKLLVTQLMLEVAGKEKAADSIRINRETLDELADPLENKSKEELRKLYKRVGDIEYYFARCVNVIGAEFPDEKKVLEDIDVVSEAKREVRRMLYEHPKKE